MWKLIKATYTFIQQFLALITEGLGATNEIMDEVTESLKSHNDENRRNRNIEEIEKLRAEQQASAKESLAELKSLE
jgi:hypothetical protein